MAFVGRKKRKKSLCLVFPDRKKIYGVSSEEEIDNRHVLAISKANFILAKSKINLFWLKSIKKTYVFGS